MIILVATQDEYALVKKHLPEFQVVRTGVGASNVIKSCSALLAQFVKAGNQEPIINIGFCGSNTLPKGTVVEVGRTFRLKNRNVEFEDYHNGLILSDSEHHCFTSNNFVTESNEPDGSIYDMELNYIAAFPFELLGSIKIVSDNLDVCEYETNVENSPKDIWSMVRELVEIISHRTPKETSL